MTIGEGSNVPLVALYSGTGGSASIVTVDYVTNLAGTQVVSQTFDAGALNAAVSDAGLSTLSGASLGGLSPPGNAVGGTCGDATLIVTELAAGIYTFLLSDAFYQPFSVNPGPPGTTLLSDGFTDLTGGSFTQCDSSSTVTCGAFAVDIMLSGLTVATPEPTTLLLIGMGLAGIGLRKRSLSRRL
jgi:hypothetical protein